MLEWKSGERCCLRERLRNEAATLAFVAANTTIPVPSCRLYTQNGLLHLETKRITNGVLLEEIDQERRAAAAAAVDHQITSFVLPQLRSLRRGYIGSVDPSIPVFPPQRVYDCDRRPWDRISAAAADALALCHNDIGPQNIFVCPDTFRIVAIIDWEVAGLFPPYFELPLWRVFDWGDEQKAVRRGECARAWVFWAQGRGFGRLSPTAVMNTSRNPTTGNGRDMVVACMCRLSSVLARIRA